jgi:ribose transport system substrate-binding protein
MGTEIDGRNEKASVSTHGGRRGFRRRGTAAIIAGTVALGALAACSSSKATTTGSTKSDSAGIADAKQLLSKYLRAPDSIGITTPLKESPPKNKTIVWLRGTDQGTSNIQLSQAWHQAADALGWKFDEVTYQSAQPATLQAAFQLALTKHPIAVGEAGMPQSLWGSGTIGAYKKAHAYIVQQAVTPDPPAGQSTVLGTPASIKNSHLMGTILGAWFVSDSSGTGQALIEHVPAFPILDGFIAGFKQEVSATCQACSLKVVNATIPQVSSGAVPGLMVSNLRSNPSYKYLIFDFSQFADGITSALSAAGLSGIKIAGEDADSSSFAALRAGTEQAWTVQNLPQQAWAGVDMLLRTLEGMPMDPGSTILPTELITKSTVGNLTDLWSVPSDWQQQFKTLWKVSS